MKVLYVEDYALGASLVYDTFRRRAPDIELDIVSTVAEAIARLDRFEQRQADPTRHAELPHYDVVLTDLNLPDGLGLEILSYVRMRRLMLAVVILTGSGNEDTVIGALHAGANDYLTKRDDYLQILPGTLRAALEHFRAETARAALPLKVLYADADLAVLDQVRSELNRRAPHLLINAAASAREVLERLRAGPAAADLPDVLLLDHRLPGLPVIDLLKEVGRITAGELPVVLVTSSGNERIAQLAIRLGVSDYLNKSDGYLQRLPFALESAYLKAASVRERAALRKSESEFRTLVDSMPDVVARFDLDGRHLYVSPAIAVTGNPPSFYVGKTHAELDVPVELARRFRDTIRRVVADGAPRKLEFDADVPSGRHWFEVVLAPEYGGDGKVGSVLSIARDVTERKLAEAAVRDAALLARSTVDALSAQMAILDETGTIIAVNLAWRRFAEENGAIGARVFEGVNYLAVCDAATVDAPQGRELAAGARAVMHGDVIEFALEYPCHSPDVRRWFVVRVTRFPGDGPIRIVIAHENISDRKQAEERVMHYRDHLEEQVAARTEELARANHALTLARDVADSANHAKSSFLANMSHEIRTPMSSIIGLARLMRTEVAPGKALDYLGKLQQAADHLLRIINDVLDLSKIEAGQFDLDESEFDLRRALEHAIDLLQSRASEKGLSVELAVDARLPQYLRGDALRLEQIVLNFLGNAIKFTADGAIRIRADLVEATAEETCLRIEVQDSGIGLTPDQQARLFQPFSQGDTSISRQHGGTGLGLVIAKRLAALMRGEVGVFSRPSPGSTFWVTARLRNGRAEAQPDAPRPEWRAQSIREFSGIRVLLAEDDPVNQLVTSQTLMNLGFEVDVVGNGAEAVEHVRTGRYALVLMDIQMPVMDGLTATRAIRQERDRHALPVIAMTANAFDDDRRLCLEAGMNEHLSKPIQPDEFHAALLRCLPAQ